MNLSVLVWHSFWEEGEPNNHIDEDCGYIVKTQVRSRVPTKSWYDAPCEMPCLFVCEMENCGVWVMDILVLSIFCIVSSMRTTKIKYSIWKQGSVKPYVSGS